MSLNAISAVLQGSLQLLLSLSFPYRNSTHPAFMHIFCRLKVNEMSTNIFEVVDHLYLWTIIDLEMTGLNVLFSLIAAYYGGFGPSHGSNLFVCKRSAVT